MTVGALPPGLRIMPADIAPIAGTATGKTSVGSFSDTLHDAVSEVDQLQQDAQFKVTSLVEGNGADVHEAMIAVEKADLSFQLMLQVRNKVVQAYQQMASMQF